jgi:hypothetical protein
MPTEVRHCEVCDHEFEVEVAAGTNVEVAAGKTTEKQVEGCPDQTEECGLANTGDRVKIRRLID